MSVKYAQFIDLFCTVKSSSFQSKELLFKAGQKKWNELKSDKQKLQEFYDTLQVKKLQPPATLLKFMRPRSTSRSNSSSSATSEPDPEITVTTASDPVPADIPAETESDHAPTPSKYEQQALTPAQTKLEKVILENTEKISAYKATINSGICPNLQEAKTKLKELEGAVADCLKKKKRLASEAERKRLARIAKKRKVEELMKEHPEISKKLQCLTTSNKTGRPVYESNDEMLNVLKELAILGSGADDRRNTEIIRSIRSLDDLTAELNNRGYALKRSAVYLRLQPRRCDSVHGKTHKTTVPVKLVRAQNDERSSNPDRWFAAMTMQHTEELAALLGSETCISMGKDDKAHVPIGVTAASKQAPLLMNLRYKVSLPDHDFVVSTKHKLTPTVLGLRKIENYPVGDRACVKFSGPTYIQVKSLKHTASNAFVQAELVDEVLDKEPDYTQIKVGDTVMCKPVVILTTDGHDGPRFPSTRAVMASIFLERDLDFIWCATNAAGLSAYHFVERRMAPLSHALSGVVLPHDSFGSHLNSKAETVDVDLEKKNFQKAGEVLCELWNDMTIDGYDVQASYRNPDDDVRSFDEPSAAWLENHCLISKYSLQISKCNNRDCCSEPRSNIHELINGQFVPGPKLLSRDSSGKIDVNSTESIKYKTRYTSLSETIAFASSLKPKGYELIEIPYDFYCPSVQQRLKSDNGHRYQCGTCFKLFTTLALADKHIKLSGHQVSLRSPAEEAVIEHDVVDLVNDGAIVIDDLAAFLSNGDADE